MTFRRSILLLIALTTIAALVGCSSSSTPPITVALNTVPSSLAFNSQTSVVASVDNDKANGGVTWTCTATPAGPGCGSFSPATTKSGASSTYTAPYTLLPSGTTITITATSVTNPAISASSGPITITAPTLANGNYVFSLQGEDNNASPPFAYFVSGVITVLSGKITAGELDFVDYNFQDYDLINPTGSSFSTTADGNLQVILVACVPASATACGANDTNLGPKGNGILTLNGSVAALNSNKFVITEFDSFASASGDLSLQNATAKAAQPSGGYAFGINGWDSNAFPLSIGGIINVDTPPGKNSTTSTISGTGSIFDANDVGNLFPAQTLSATAGANSVTAPDSFGRVVFTLTPTDTTNFGTIALVGYIVDSTRVKLVETVDTNFGTTGGTALVQGSNTGTFTATSVSGNTYVTGLAGQDVNGYLQVATQLTMKADNTVSGYVNYNDLSGTGPTTPSPLTGGTWLEDAKTGRVTLTGVTDGTLTFDAQAYLDGNGNLMALTMDNFDAVGGPGFEQTGGASIGASSFTNAYTLGVTGYDPTVNEYEFDAAGNVVADGIGTFTGTADVNWNLSTGPTYTDAPVSGAFTAAASAPFKGTVKGLDLENCKLFTAAGAGCTDDTFVYYMIDANGQNIAIETDDHQLSLGYFDQQ